MNRVWIIVALVAVLVIGAAGNFVFSVRGDALARAEPLVKRCLPVIATWNSHNYQPYFTPDTMAVLNTPEGQERLARLSRLGTLDHFDEPELESSVIDEKVGVSKQTVTVFNVHAYFEHSEADVKLTMVDDGAGYLIDNMSVDPTH